MRKVKRTFYIDEKIAELLREYAYITRKPMSKIVEEAIELLEREFKNYLEKCKDKKDTILS